MKKVFSILFTATILFVSMSNGIVYGLFKIKQSEIVEKLCVNRNQPSKHCEGKCFLKDRFEEKNNDAGDSAPMTNIEESVKINLIQPFSIEPAQVLLNTPENIAGNLLFFSPQSFLDIIFQPPELLLSINKTAYS